MRRLGPLLAALALSLSPIAPAAGQGVEVSAIDDVFRPETIRIPVGGTVTWINEGRNPHTATADDGAWDSGNLDPGDTSSLRFDEPGAIPYFCRYHGAAGGLGMAGTILVGDVQSPEAQEGPPQPPPGEGDTLRVPADHPTIQAAVNTAVPGDLVLVSPGVYRESVRVTTPFLTIRGTDRNEVIVDGEFSRENGVHVLEADGVAVENMTARNHTLNGFYWTGVEGYRGSYLTAYNNGDYGIYAFDSVYGQFDHSYASGSPDAGFYIGQCRPCHAVISDVVAEGNALGYSGTNAGGKLYIVRSEWRNNMSGIVPNTLDSQLLAPQGEVVIAGNWIHDNNNREAPAKRLQYPTFGSGVLLAGGTDNLVVRNRVEGHERYGIAAVPNLDANLWVTEGNEVRANLVSGSGEADLALGGPAAGRDCFAENDHRRSLPPAIEALAGCGLRLTGGAGDLGVTFSLLGRFAQALSGDFPQGDYRTAPVPPPQETMPDAETAPPAPAVDVPMKIDVAGVALPPGGSATPARHTEVTVLGISVAAPTWWGLLISVYGYLLPLVLYAAWVSVAAWDLVRRDGPTTRARIGWLAVVLLVPFLGPILYFVFGRSPIPAALRWMLVGGGLGAYLIFAGISFLLASS